MGSHLSKDHQSANTFWGPRRQRVASRTRAQRSECGWCDASRLCLTNMRCKRTLKSCSATGDTTRNSRATTLSILTLTTVLYCVPDQSGRRTDGARPRNHHNRARQCHSRCKQQRCSDDHQGGAGSLPVLATLRLAIRPELVATDRG